MPGRDEVSLRKHKGRDTKLGIPSLWNEITRIVWLSRYTQTIKQLQSIALAFEHPWSEENVL